MRLTNQHVIKKHPVRKRALKALYSYNLMYIILPKANSLRVKNVFHNFPELLTVINTSASVTLLEQRPGKIFRL